MEKAASIERISDGKSADFSRHLPTAHTGIIIADGRVAKFFKNNAHSLDLIAMLDAKSAGRPAVTGGHTRIRYLHSCHQLMRSLLQRQGMPREHEAFIFAREIARWLEKTALEYKCEKLILVASPPMLGNIRKTISKQVRALVKAEAARDLTKMKEKHLYNELRRIVRF